MERHMNLMYGMMIVFIKKVKNGMVHIGMKIGIIDGQIPNGMMINKLY